MESQATLNLRMADLVEPRRSCRLRVSSDKTTGGPSLNSWTAHRHPTSGSCHLSISGRCDSTSRHFQSQAVVFARRKPTMGLAGSCYFVCLAGLSAWSTFVNFALFTRCFALFTEEPPVRSSRMWPRPAMSGQSWSDRESSS